MTTSAGEIEREGDLIDIGDNDELRVWQDGEIVFSVAPGAWCFWDVLAEEVDDGERESAPVLTLVGKVA